MSTPTTPPAADSADSADSAGIAVTSGAPPEHVVPTLSAAQLERMAGHGRRRAIRAHQVLSDAERKPRVFVLLRGRLEAARVAGESTQLIRVLEPGQFTGEMSALAGRRSLVRITALEDGEVVEVDREHLLSLVQADAELSEILMRAFILRRVELIAQGLGDVVDIGSAHCAATLRFKEFLTRHGHPFAYFDLDHDDGVQELLDRFRVGVEDIPILICRGNAVLRDPSNHEIAECLGLNAPVDPAQVRDVLIVGAGPAGLAAAVNGASEGLDVMVLESEAPGGQAGSSSRIENYLGFPNGISGQSLAARAYTQAQKFGAQMIVASSARRLRCGGHSYAVETDDGSTFLARTVIIATGAVYRRLAVPDPGRFEGVGVYYGATAMEAQLCRAEDVVVVGGGNAAGQAAVFLSQTARRVHMLVRGAGLAETMSRYLIRRIETSDVIELRTRTEIVGLEGVDRLQRVLWRDGARGETGSFDCGHVFVMAGAEPATRWLDGCVALDAKGFVKTGPEVTAEDRAGSAWPLSRQPHLLETSRPGIFAVGDVRGGSMKRVASAVGEGSTAIAFVHRVLAG
jgi:thioredoxin reductase (NADPH)